MKLGGSTLGASDTSLRDIADARRERRQIVVVHGGGATIGAWLDRAGIEAKFVRGLRATSAEALEIVVAVLGGIVNKRLVAELSALGAPAIGLSGADGMVLQARRYDEDLGFVGEVHRVNPYPLEDLLRFGYLPVVAPLGIELDEDDAPPQLLNLNADTAAGHLAAALGAESLIFLTDVDAVLDEGRRPIRELSPSAARKLIDDGAAAGGMIPKLEAAVLAATAGCATAIANGTTPGVLSSLLAGSRAGTRITT